MLPSCDSGERGERRMNVAWVTPYLPEPATSGGAIRQQRLAAALAAHADIPLFARGEPWERRRLRSRELGLFARTWLGRDYLPSRRPTNSTRIRRRRPASPPPPGPPA